MRGSNTTMRAAVFHGPRDVRCETLERPAIGPGEALLRVRACGICGSDLHTYRHGLFEQLGTPVATGSGGGRVLGHEFSGEVVEVGAGASLAPGDRVVAVGIGANAEYVKIDASGQGVTTRIADHVGFEEAATTEPLATSLHAVNLAAPRDGETHVIFGAGIIGLGVLQCVKAMAKARIITVDLSDRRLAMASKLGSDVVINARETDVYEAIAAETGGSTLGLVEARTANVDTVYDCAGMTKDFTGVSVLEQALSIVRQDGKVVVVAVFEKPLELDVNVIMRKGVRLVGSWAWTPPEFAQALELIETGRIDRSPLVSHRFGIDAAHEAYETQLLAEEAVKVMFTP